MSYLKTQELAICTHEPVIGIGVSLGEFTGTPVLQGQCSREGHRHEALAAMHTEAQGCKRDAEGLVSMMVGTVHSCLQWKEMKEE